MSLIEKYATSNISILISLLNIFIFLISSAPHSYGSVRIHAILNVESGTHADLLLLNYGQQRLILRSDVVLSVKVNTGQMDQPDQQWALVCSNLSLIQVPPRCTTNHTGPVLPD